MLSQVKGRSIMVASLQPGIYSTMVKQKEENIWVGHFFGGGCVPNEARVDKGHHFFRGTLGSSSRLTENQKGQGDSRGGYQVQGSGHVRGGSGQVTDGSVTRSVHKGNTKLSLV